MLPAMCTFHNVDTLIDRLARSEHSRKHVFLFGSALTAPYPPDGKGVLGVRGIVDLIEQYHRKNFPHGLLDLQQPLEIGQNQYQNAFKQLLARTNVDAANAIIRQAVLSAYVGTEIPDPRAPNACAQAEGDPTLWYLPPWLQALGLLMTRRPEQLANLVLTTNFDPLIELAIEHSGGRAQTSALDKDRWIETIRDPVCQVIHLNGHWTEADTLHTQMQLNQPRPMLAEFLVRLIEENAIVVLGYGGWEDVFSQALDAALKRYGGKAEILWAFYESSEDAIKSQNQALLARLKQGHDRGHVALYKGVDLRTLLPQLQSRLTPDAAVERRPSASAADARTEQPLSNINLASNKRAKKPVSLRGDSTRNQDSARSAASNRPKGRKSSAKADRQVATSRWKKALLAVLISLLSVCVPSGLVVLMVFCEVKCSQSGGYAASMSASFSANGKWVLSSSGDIGQLWDAKTGKPICDLNAHKDYIRKSTISLESDYAATVGTDNMIGIWDLRSCKLVTKISGHSSKILDASFAPGGQLIAAAENDWLIHIYHSATGHEVRRLGGLPGVALSVEFSPDGKQILTSNSPQNSAITFSVETGQILHEYKGHTDIVYSSRYSLDGNFIVTASNDKSVRVWDVSTGNLIKLFSGHKAPATMARFSHDNKNVVSASEDQTARIWDMQSNNSIVILGHKRGITDVDFSPDGASVVTSSYDGSVVLWDARDGERLRDLKAILLCIRNPAAC